MATKRTPSTTKKSTRKASPSAASTRTTSAPRTAAARAPAPAAKRSRTAASSGRSAAAPAPAPAAADANRTYLELSEDGGGSHKFYEVVIDGTKVSIRYGRIGDGGQKQEQKFRTAAEALGFAQKKINEKKKKGYEAAVQGVRQKRAVTRRTITSKPSAEKDAPVLWKFDSGDDALGIYIDTKLFWVGNQKGAVFAVTADGTIEQQYKLPDGVKCIIADDDWRYAGCDDGNVYDLGGHVPRLAYEVEENVDIFWIDIYRGKLCVSDAGGNLAIFDHENETNWRKKSKGYSGWMVRADEKGVYHGHSSGVTKYAWKDGKTVWEAKTKGAVLFGWQEASDVYAGTSEDKIHVFTKDGKPGVICDCDDSIYSCAASPGGKYIFGGDSSSSVYCFDSAGKRLWKLATGCGSAYSMQYRDERLYIVTTDGALACIDVSEEAIQKAQAGEVPAARDIKAPSKVEEIPSTQLETTRDTSKGVIVECVKQAGKLRMRVVSPGFKSSYNCQFPRNIRVEGAKYVVDDVREVAGGGFYRVLGEIRRLAQ
ncbi:WGR domain-containing protein [Polyangium spumosum]|uniref:WGR domain-containing protein n=1 Tax=Polyangium spumosum TaxID=889282 RepID=A0A6N7PMF7_9BACT|nr:WGR domain-containing protein [Polyangium spumosum]MRG93188.1 WGR domain-containing protein [Polyangium spumosum]